MIKETASQKPDIEAVDQQQACSPLPPIRTVEAFRTSVSEWSAATISPFALDGAHGSSLQRVVRRRPIASGVGKQEIYTPDELAKLIVSHFRPSGKICEPCRGDGAFVRAMPGCDWYEIEEGRDWMTAEGKWDWIVTNPPWREVGPFLEKSMQCADNIVFLCWASAWWTKARQRLIAERGFGMAEMMLVKTPPAPWPQSGFLLAATWVRRGWTGSTAITQPPND